MSDLVDEEVVELFNSLDLNQNGLIERSELERGLRAAGVPITRDKVDLIMEAFDEENKHDKQLDLEEFAHFLTLSKLRVLFDELDEDSSGFIDKDELMKAFNRVLGVKLDTDELDVLFNAVDHHPDGQISWNEFAQFFEGFRGEAASELLDFLRSNGSDLDLGNSFGVSTYSLTSRSAWASIMHTWVAGAAGGVAARAVLAPLDRVLILQQTGGITASRAVKDVYLTSSLRGFWRGNMSALAKVVPFNGIVCAAYVPLVDKLVDTNSAYAWYGRVAAGAAAGFLATAATHPLDVARARIAVSMGQQQMSVSKALIEGGVYHGFGATLLTMTLFIAFQQSLYDRLKFELRPESPAGFLGLGILAGAAAQSAVHPLDTLRRQAQTLGEKRGLFQLAMDMYREGGLGGFYRGLKVAVLKIGPTVGLTLLVRDAVLGRLPKKNQLKI